jgi:hypothetical protein
VLGGVCGVADGAGAGVAGVPPLPELGAEPEPDEPELPPEELLDLFFFDEGVVVDESVGIGDVVLGSKVWTGALLSEPPPDATAITTIRKKRPAHPRATSLRRR